MVVLVTENMIAQNSATSLLTSFVAFVAARVIWPGIVPSIKILNAQAVSINGPSPSLNRTGFDSEYASLMAELGENAGAGDPGRRLGMLPAWVGMISPLVGRIFLHGVDQNRGSSLPTIINSKVSGPLKEDMEQDMEAQDTEHRARRGAGYAANGYQQPQDYSNYASYYQGQYAQ